MINVMYASSSSYLSITLLSIYSLIENNPMQQLNIFFIADGLNDLEKNKLRRLENEFLYVTVKIYNINDFSEKIFALSMVDYRQSIFTKFYIDRLNVDKVLFIDSDTIFVNSITELFEVDMNNYLIAGVSIPSPRHYNRNFAITNNDVYLNFGIVLFNVKKWKEMNIRKKIFDLIDKTNVEFIEENIINSVCQGYILEISPQYNLMSSYIYFKGKKYVRIFGGGYRPNEIDEAIKNPIIIHYLNEIYIRPWFNNTNHPLKKYFINENYRHGKIVRIDENDQVKKGGIFRRLPFFILKKYYKNKRR